MKKSALLLLALFAVAAPAFAANRMENFKMIRCRGDASLFNIGLEQTGISDSGFVYRAVQSWRAGQNYSINEALGLIAEYSGADEFRWLEFSRFRAPLGDRSRAPDDLKAQELNDSKKLVIYLAGPAGGPGLVVSKDADTTAIVRNLSKDTNPPPSDRLNCFIEVAP